MQVGGGLGKASFLHVARDFCLCVPVAAANAPPAGLRAVPGSIVTGHLFHGLPPHMCMKDRQELPGPHSQESTELVLFLWNVF